MKKICKYNFLCAGVGAGQKKVKLFSAVTAAAAAAAASDEKFHFFCLDKMKNGTKEGMNGRNRDR